jgi:hypothetical protein
MLQKLDQLRGQSLTGAGYSEQSVASTVQNPPDGGDKNLIAVLEAEIEYLTQQNVELLHRSLGQPYRRPQSTKGGSSGGQSPRR